MDNKRRKTNSEAGSSRGSWRGRGRYYGRGKKSSSAALSSFVGFQTTQPSMAGTRGRERAFSRQGSVLRTSAAPYSQGLPTPILEERASLGLPSSAHHGSSIFPHLHEGAPHLETEEEIREREDADAMNEIVLAIDMKERGTLGCAYYIAREEKLFLMADIKLAGLDIVDTLKLHTSPTVILISTKSDEMLDKHLLEESKDASNGDNPGMLRHQLV